MTGKLGSETVELRCFSSPFSFQSLVEGLLNQPLDAIGLLLQLCNMRTTGDAVHWALWAHRPHASCLQPSRLQDDGENISSCLHILPPFQDAQKQSNIPPPPSLCSIISNSRLGKLFCLSFCHLTPPTTDGILRQWFIFVEFDQSIREINSLVKLKDSRISSILGDSICDFPRCLRESWYTV